MNCILLILIILASAFVSSSANNILAVTGGLDYYFDKAGISDYLVATISQSMTEKIKTKLDNLSSVEKSTEEPIIYLSNGNVFCNGTKTEAISNMSFILPCDKMQLTYFDDNNNPVNSVQNGKVFISSASFMKKAKIKVGDKIEIKVGNVKKSFEIAGHIKDAALGGQLMDGVRFFVSPDDFAAYYNDSDGRLLSGGLFYITSNDVSSLENELNDLDSGIAFMASRDLLKFSYVMDVVVAFILLIVSVCLILVSFAALSFTITFSLNEEFREIGVMKAIGIDNAKIRGLYIVKYIALACVGTVIGFFAGIPFGKMLLKSVSEKMVLETENGYLINIICAAAVAAVITLFSFGCTAKVKKYSPVDAVRSGETGERFHKKGILHFCNSRLDTVSFLAANDVLCTPKKYAVITLAFTLCLSLVIVIANIANTLKSADMIKYIGVSSSDVYYSDSENLIKASSPDAVERPEDYLDKIDKILAGNNIPAKSSIDVLFYAAVNYKNNICKPTVYKGYRIDNDKYFYTQGSAPQKSDEVALTRLTSDKLGAKIGDTITINWNSGERKYIVTAIYQTVFNMGDGVRLYKDAYADYKNIRGMMDTQIDFNDNPTPEVINDRIEKLKVVFDSREIRNAKQYCASKLGRFLDTLTSIKILVIAISMIIAALVTALVERSFIEKEKGETAMLKAIGFKNSNIIKRDTMRLMLAAAVSATIAIAVSTPLTMLTVNPIMAIMGATEGVNYEIVPKEVFVLYPLIMIAATTLTAFAVSLYTIKIKASDASNIE